MEKTTLLVIDDDPIVRDVFKDIFSYAQGYEIESALNGDEGLKKIAEHDYEMVFTDIAMPGMTGIDFMREAKKIRPSLPIVIITGYSTLENAVSAMREGARDFITKPFNVRTVVSVVERITSEARLHKNILLDNDYQTFISKINQELIRKIQEIGVMQAIFMELDGISDNKEIYSRLAEMASRLMMAKTVSFGILEQGTLKIKRAIGVPEKDISVAGTLFETVIRTRNYCIAQPGMPDPHTGMPLQSHLISIPLMIKDDIFGIMNISGKADGASFTEDEVAIALTFSRKAAQRIENNALYEVFYNNLINTLKSLVKSIEARDLYTRHHSERVTEYASRIASEMGLSAEEKDAIRFGGYLHDIGKIGVRDTVLLKPERLTPQEYDEIKLHPVIGGNIIQPIRFFPKERELILHHHERFDGRGYPQGLSGEDIPIAARILAVADSYDAMTSSRPYRAALSRKEALEEIRRCQGSQFDRRVVGAFMNVIRNMPDGLPTTDD